MPANSVTTAAIGDGAVTADKIDFATYSTTEKVVGKWTNGKSIYRRVFTGTITASSGTRGSTLLMTGVEQVIVASGYVYEATAGTRLIVPSTWVNTSGAMIGAGYVLVDGSGNANLLTWFSTASRTSVPYSVAIDYTKI